MATYDYNKNYKPPAPVTEIKISTNLSEQIEEGTDITKNVEMLIDTGADRSLIPRRIITELENLLGKKLPYKVKEVWDYNGKKFFHKTYLLNVLSQPDKFGDNSSIYFLEFDGDEGIVGRDILNNYLVCLNGPELKWTLGETGK